MIKYPLYFHGKSEAGPGMKTSWNTSASDREVMCSVPAQFEGDGTYQSPEDYFLLAVQNCFVATFKVYAQYSNLEFKTLSLESSLEVNPIENGKTVMKSVTLKISLSGVTNENRAKILIQKTLANGFILQSVKSEIKTEITITP